MGETELLENILDSALSETYTSDGIGNRQQDMIGIIVDHACSGKQKAALAGGIKDKQDKSAGQPICTAIAARRVASGDGRNERIKRSV